jgi:hypothetical protein
MMELRANHIGAVRREVELMGRTEPTMVQFLMV